MADTDDTVANTDEVLVPGLDFIDAQAQIAAAVATQQATFDAARSALNTLLEGQDAYYATHTVAEAQAYSRAVSAAQVEVDHARIALAQAVADQQTARYNQVQTTRQAEYDKVSAATERMRTTFDQQYGLLADAIATLFEAVEQINLDAARINGMLPDGVAPIAGVDDYFDSVHSKTCLPGYFGEVEYWRGNRFVNTTL